MINYIFYIIYIFSQFLFANDDVVDWDKDTIKTNAMSQSATLIIFSDGEFMPKINQATIDELFNTPSLKFHENWDLHLID